MADHTTNGHNAQQRDVAHERAFTAAAAGLLERSPVPITQLAEQRAPLDPLRDFPWRDLHEDALEELADCRNYTAWAALRLDLARIGTHDAHESRAALQRALAHIVEAFAEIKLSRSLESGLRPAPDHA